MLFKKVIHSILIITLIIQLFPTNPSGRFIVENTRKEHSSELPDAKVNQLRQFIEEDHKDICLDHNWVIVGFVHIANTTYHFSEALPLPQFGTIHTPPPNFIA